MILAFAIGAILGASPVAAATTPKAFLERLYAGYRNPDFSPFAHPERIFAPRLISAMNEDAQLAHGEVGYVDADPVCQCQESAGMRAKVVSAKLQGTNKATANVLLRFGEHMGEKVKFSLVRTKAGWRIADVSSSDEPSFLRAIENSNRSARANH
ncbi:MAG: DUF3828 domain-containing protein [Sphingomonas sp.]|nr:DUF3828 domain-containing protein [Sphingomonas sp.]